METNVVEKTFNITDREKNGRAALSLKSENSVWFEPSIAIK